MNSLKVVRVMSNKEHMLFCVLGRTSSGKDTLVNKLCEKTGAKQLISYTTRPRRDREEDTHIFVAEGEYEKMLADGQVAVDTNINGNYYWSTIEQLYGADVYILDYLGLKKLKELNLPNIRLVSVFINTPDEIRKERALNERGDDKKTFASRNFSEKRQFEEMLKKGDFDYSLRNIKFPESFSVFKWIYTAEG